MTDYPEDDFHPEDGYAENPPAASTLDAAIAHRVAESAMTPAARNADAIKRVRDALDHNAQELRWHDAATAELLKRCEETLETRLQALRKSEELIREDLRRNADLQRSAEAQAEQAGKDIREKRSTQRAELLREAAMLEAFLAAGAQATNG